MKRNYYVNLTILGLLLISSCHYLMPSISCQYYDDDQAPEITTSQTSITTPSPAATTSLPGKNQTQLPNSIEKLRNKKNKSKFFSPSLFDKSEGVINSTAKLFPCPQSCQCNDNRTEVICINAAMSTVPSAIKSYTNLTSLSLRNNSLETFNLNSVNLDSLVTLDLSMNELKNLTASSVPYKQKLKLTNLNLSSNKLATLETFKYINLSSLINLDLSDNNLAKFDPMTISYPKDINPFPNLLSLNLAGNPISLLAENAFKNMTKLNRLILDGALKPAATAKLLNHGKMFESNSALYELDLSNLELTEVPISARNIPNLTSLILDRNRFTSLRPSDFRGLNNLVRLHIRQCPQLTRIDPFTFGDTKSLQILNLSHNPKLSDFSMNALTNASSRELQEVDLSYNNLTSLPDLLEVVHIGDLKLNNNPWHCDCSIMWLQSRTLTLHCAMPEKRKDLEIHTIQFEECRQPHGPGSHGSYHFLLTCVVLVLFAFVVAFILRKSQVCRRLLWRDQYGNSTVYYTKASFPAGNAT